MSSSIGLMIKHNNTIYPCRTSNKVLTFSHTADSTKDLLEAIVDMASFPDTELRGDITITINILLNKKVVKSFVLKSDYVKIVRGSDSHKVVAVVDNMEILRYFPKTNKYDG